MYEVSCPGCQAFFQGRVDDYIHLCPFCAVAFFIDSETGEKEQIEDHFILPATLEKDQAVSVLYDWLSRETHRPSRVKKDFQILQCSGVVLPYWVVSLEVQTRWSGYSPKKYEGGFVPRFEERREQFIREEGHFHRRYRWAVAARNSPKEHWGIDQLHVPEEKILVDWAGFPFDESLGLPPEGQKKAYEAKVKFRFEHMKEQMSLAGVQRREAMAIAQAKDHLNTYHRRIAKTKTGSLDEHETEIEVVGVQLVHIPFWVGCYAQKQGGAGKMFSHGQEKRFVIQGYTQSVLFADPPFDSSFKLKTHITICGMLVLAFLLLSVFVHSFFYIVFGFVFVLATLSLFKMQSARERLLQ